MTTEPPAAATEPPATTTAEVTAAPAMPEQTVPPAMPEQTAAPAVPEQTAAPAVPEGPTTTVNEYGQTPLLTREDVTQTLCGNLRLGALDCVAFKEDGDQKCKCIFLGHKPKTCPSIFGAKKFSKVKRGTRFGFFSPGDCACEQPDPEQWHLSHCDLWPSHTDFEQLARELAGR